MFASTDGVLNANQDKVNTVKALAAATVELGTDIQNIKTKDKEFDEKSTAKGKLKNQDVFIGSSYPIAGGGIPRYG